MEIEDAPTPDTEGGRFSHHAFTYWSSAHNNNNNIIKTYQDTTIYHTALNPNCVTKALMMTVSPRHTHVVSLPRQTAPRDLELLPTPRRPRPNKIIMLRHMEQPPPNDASPTLSSKIHKGFFRQRHPSTTRCLAADASVSVVTRPAPSSELVAAASPKY